MNAYEKLLSINDDIVIDDLADLPNDYKGYSIEFNSNKVILISKKIKTIKEKRCILVEEIGHLETTFGDITNQSNLVNRKLEIKARAWGYEKLVNILDIINAYKNGVSNRYEFAEYLGVTEEFLEDSIEHYKRKYGLCVTVGNYTIYFSPLSVLEMF